MADPNKTNLWTDKESGIMRRVDKVDEHWATITVVKANPSHYSMPVAEYDSTFVEQNDPVDAGAMVLPDAYRPPLNAIGVTEERSDLDTERGETPRGVQIGA